MWFVKRRIQFFCCAALVACFGASPLLAQQSQTQQKPPQPYGGGTPLDVILNTRFWTDVPEAQDFVKAARPPEDSLEYQSTGGKDITRPRPDTPEQLKSMEDELERAGAAADHAAGIKNDYFHVPPKTAPKKRLTAKPAALHHKQAQN
ncbi:MAG TPA: hypothetical protein VKV77_02670 [Methylovirgula sp.]|nr:hypothetical protein [Methylovirgula sp.]